jgi:hypothetical protein
MAATNQPTTPTSQPNRPTNQPTLFFAWSYCVGAILVWSYSCVELFFAWELFFCVAGAILCVSYSLRGAILVWSYLWSYLCGAICGSYFAWSYTHTNAHTHTQNHSQADTNNKQQTINQPSNSYLTGIQM